MATEVKTEAAPKVGPVIHMTEHAAKKILALLAKEGVSPETGGLRVGVQGGGCSGLSYAMRLDTHARDRDKVFEELAREYLWTRKACRISMALPWNMRRRSCGKDSFFRIPTPRGIAAAAVRLRLSSSTDWSSCPGGF